MMATTIPRLKKCINSLTTEKLQLKKELTELKDDVAKNKEVHQKSKDNVKEWLNKVLFYQDTLFEILQRVAKIDDL